MGKFYVRGDHQSAEALGISFQEDQAVHVFGWLTREPTDYFSMRLTPDEADRFARELSDQAKHVREYLAL